ncbi:MAG: polysaccharide biosynthesis protein, partial [Bacteroidetes bacterium]|nr:polysaccharide biosynthesis protein [Bacteroidota bacterium]
MLKIDFKILSDSFKNRLKSFNTSFHQKANMSVVFGFQKIVVIVIGLPRIAKQLIVFAVDCFYILFTVWLTFSLRYERAHIPISDDWFAYVGAILIALPIFIISGLYRSIFRYSGFSALSAVAFACLQYGILYFIAIVFMLPKSIPWTIGILQPLLLLLGIGSSRAIARFWFHPGNVKNSKSCNKEKILIYGAGEAGIQISSALHHNARYNVEGFIDDDELLQDKSINGVTIYSPNCVQKIVQDKSITSILLALPSVKKARRKEIIKAFDGLDINIRTLPGIEEMADGKLSISDIREIEIEDLLGRDPVAPNLELFERCIKNKSVLVTGAGGSIGSELCRQIISLNPVRLILIEQSEYNLYVLNNELDERIRNNGYGVQIVTLLADVTDRENIKKIFDRYLPETVYHAAAYKHVPLVECNPLEGLRNNVFGTLSVAEASKNFGVKNFILVSTDKAVRPTNIMGASK